MSEAIAELELEIKSRKKLAERHFLENEFEDRKNGLGILTEVKKLDLSVERLMEKGRTISESNSKDIAIIPLEAAIKMGKINSEEAKAITNILFSRLKKDKLEYMHAALCNLYLIKVPQTRLKDVIKIKSLLEGNTHNHYVLLVGDNTDASIMFESASARGDQTFLHTQSVSVIIGDNSKVTFADMRESDGDIVYSMNYADVGKNSKLTIITLALKTKLSVTENYSKMSGDGSSIKSVSLYLGKNGEEQEISSVAEHEGKNTSSLLLCSGILDNSKITTKGLIRINPDASGSDGYQQADAILIGDSRSISIPDLEIHNNDVKCTHGSTTSRIDSEKLFYMQSRGFSKEDAERAMIEGFYIKALKEVEDEDVRYEALRMITTNMGE